MAMALSSSSSVDKFAQYHPTVLTLKRLIDFGVEKTAEKTSFQFLSKELPVRFANIMKEFAYLPEKLRTMPSVQQVGQWYEHSFQDVLQFTDKNMEINEELLNKFSSMLDQMRNRHSTVVETMAEGIFEMKRGYGEAAEDAHTSSCIQYFLDRLYANRIGIQVLVKHHLMLFSGMKTDKHCIGAIDPECDILSIAEDAYENARFLCEQYYMTCPEIKFECHNPFAKSADEKNFTLTYIPSHLYHMLFELLKNAVRAVVEHHQSKDEDDLPPVRVLICQGHKDITIRISDQGGGIRRSQLVHLFDYMYTTAPRPEDGQTMTPLAGYGYGLPLSRLYARYFNGDLWLNSIDGFGTDAMICLKLFPKDASELLPIFNRTASLKYTQSEQVADWSDPSSIMERR